VPSLPALLSYSAWEVFSYLGPFLRAIRLNEVKDEAVLILSPGPLDQARVKDLLPSMKTLNISPAWKSFSDLLPIFPSVLLHRVTEHEIFLLGPMTFGVLSMVVI
jgi:hypothetical protein